MQYGNYKVINPSNVSPILTSTKLSQPLHKSNYNSVNVSSQGGNGEKTLLNVSNEGGQAYCSGNASSGGNTPSHMSQQNLIKIMKKIKNSNSGLTSQANKENVAVAPPNIITSQQPPRLTCIDSLHPSGSTTPTDQGKPQTQNMFQKHAQQAQYNSNKSINSALSQGPAGQKKVICISKLNNFRSSKDPQLQGPNGSLNTSNNAPGSQSHSATNQNQKMINLQQVTQQLQQAANVAQKQVQNQPQPSYTQVSHQEQKQQQYHSQPSSTSHSSAHLMNAQNCDMSNGRQINTSNQMNVQRQEVSPVHIHYHNKNIIQVSLNVSPTNAQPVKITATATSSGGNSANHKQTAQVTQQQTNNTQTTGVTVSTVFLGDNQRKKSLGDKPQISTAQTNNFNRKSSIPTKKSQNNSVQNVSPISSHRGSASASTTNGLMKKQLMSGNGGVQQTSQNEGNKFDFNFAQQIHQKLQMQQQQQIQQQQQSITLEDSIDNTQAQAQQQQQTQQRINFYPNAGQQIHNEVSFSQAQVQDPQNQPQIILNSQTANSNAKAQIIHSLSRYIKLKQTDINIDLNDEIMENLKEFLTYLEKKNIINITQLEQDKNKLQGLIQDIMKLDLTKLKQTRQEMESHDDALANQNTAATNSSQFLQQRGSVSSNKTSRRQGTPVSQIALTGNTNQSDSSLSSSISSKYNKRHRKNNLSQRVDFSNFQKRRCSIIGSGDTSPNSHKPRTNSQQSNQSKTGNNVVQQCPAPTINVSVHGKVNNINISPISIVGNNNSSVFGTNVQSSTSSQNKPFLLNEHHHQQQAVQNQPQQMAVGPTNKLLIQELDAKKYLGAIQQQNVGGRRGSDGQIIQRNIAKLQNQSAITKKIQHPSGSGNDIVEQSGIPQRRVGSAEQKRTDNSKMKLEIQHKPLHGQAQAQKIIQDPDQMSTQECTGASIGPTSFNINNEIMQDREKLIKYNRAYIKKNKKIPTTTLDFYKFVKLIGKGAFGKVTLGIHKLTGKYVAIKAIDKNYMKDDFSKKKVFQEVFILKKIRHSNIIRLLEVFESQKHFLMVMEYAGGGDLLQYVKQRKRLEEQEAKYMFKQIVFGLGHCHCRSVLHRDIKLDNILMDVEGSIKICDFGVSRLINKGQIIQEQCGTPAYLAPEIIADEGYEGFYVDIWSLGVLLYAMLQGTVPFKASNLQDLHALILQGNFQYPVAISADARDLIQRMLMLVPHQRISIPEVLNHPWMKGALDPDGIEGTEEDDDHDFRMGLSFQRQECNLNPLLNPGAAAAGTGAQSSQVNADQSPLYSGGNINQVNIDNLFYDGQITCKLSYMNYCALTQDYYTHRIDEEAIRVLENFGYPRQMVIESLNRGDLNHATASYNLLVLP